MRDMVDIGKIIDLSQYEVDNIIQKQTISLQELENKSIIIQSIESFINRKYNKKGVRIRILVDNQERVLITTSMIIVKQLLDIHAKCIANDIQLPEIKCTVIKDKGYFRLV